MRSCNVRQANQASSIGTNLRPRKFAFGVHDREHGRTIALGVGEDAHPQIDPIRTPIGVDLYRVGGSGDVGSQVLGHASGPDQEDAHGKQPSEE